MRLQHGGLMAAAILVLSIMAPRAEAAILAQDDFSGPGSGTGWAAGNNWEGLGGGVASTAGGVASFRDFAAPIDGTNGVTYVRFDFTETVPGTGSQWGGAALFEGVEGSPGLESLFVGHPGQPASPPPKIGLDQLPGQLLSDVVIGTQPHTLIAEVDTTPAGEAANYRLWVDSFNIGAPTATRAVADTQIAGPWRTFRLQANAPVTQLFDNLTIATTAREVGLVPEPASLGLFGLFVVMALGINGRRR
jgi:hypothetical protein